MPTSFGKVTIKLTIFVLPRMHEWHFFSCIRGYFFLHSWQFLSAFVAIPFSIRGIKIIRAFVAIPFSIRGIKIIRAFVAIPFSIRGIKIIRAFVAIHFSIRGNSFLVTYPIFITFEAVFIDLISIK